MLFSHLVVSGSVTPWTESLQVSLSFTVSCGLLILTHIAIQPSHPCCPLLLLSSVFPSIRGFSNDLALRIRWPKYRTFSFSISPSSEYSALTSFRIGWFDVLAVQETLKSLLQHHSSKVSILQHSALHMVQLSQSVHDYWGKKNIALTIQIFVSKVTEYI